MSFPTLDELKEDEIKAEKRLREIRDSKEKLEQRIRDIETDSIKPIVIRAHNLLCQWEHTSGCGWHYEIDSNGIHHWVGQHSSHARWLAHYEKLLEKKNYGPQLTTEKLSVILDHIEELKKLYPDVVYLFRHGLVP